MSWTDPPDHDYVQSTYRSKPALVSEIKEIELRISIVQARISIEKPRNTAVRLVGTNPENSRELADLFDRLNAVNRELQRVQAEIDFLEFHLEMFKSISYRRG